MNRLRRLLTNKGSSVAYAAITTIYTIVPEDYFKVFNFFDKWSDSGNVLFNRILLCVLIFILANMAYQAYRRRRKKITIHWKSYSVHVEYGDLLGVSGGKKVIHFDECFSTAIGEAPSDIKPASICGQYLQKHTKDDVQEVIAKSGVRPERGQSRFNGQARYKLGTIVPNGELMHKKTRLAAYTHIKSRSSKISIIESLSIAT